MLKLFHFRTQVNQKTFDIALNRQGLSVISPKLHGVQIHMNDGCAHSWQFPIARGVITGVAAKIDDQIGLIHNVIRTTATIQPDRSTVIRIALNHDGLGIQGGHNWRINFDGKLFQGLLGP